VTGERSSKFYKVVNLFQNKATDISQAYNSKRDYFNHQQALENEQRLLKVQAP